MDAEKTDTLNRDVWTSRGVLRPRLAQTRHIFLVCVFTKAEKDVNPPTTSPEAGQGMIGLAVSSALGGLLLLAVCDVFSQALSFQGISTAPQLHLPHPPPSVSPLPYPSILPTFRSTGTITPSCQIPGSIQVYFNPSIPDWTSPLSDCQYYQVHHGQTGNRHQAIYNAINYSKMSSTYTLDSIHIAHSPRRVHALSIREERHSRHGP
ncbi:hypothetical protein PV11_09185 [Exophiala sideris]|uniref:Uncharacterized protein n=1 Tax=Exophiala sideris TaxID=1016849 RepID=A0A0D1YR02_9EURO|nr:hypothetical protein PV11_09185 [Exophiala sideris]